MTPPDFFTQITAEIFGVGYMDVDRKTRRRVKSVILQLTYSRTDSSPASDQLVRATGTATGRMRTPQPPIQ